MKVVVLVLGPLDTNTYILSKDGKCIIIDPADDAEKIVSFCSKYEVEEIIVTHHHFDHIGALEKLEKYYNIKHNTFLRKTFSYDIIKTPGHTDDSISIFFGGFLPLTGKYISEMCFANSEFLQVFIYFEQAIWLFLKTLILVILIMLIRASYPRLNSASLMKFSWNLLLPLSILNFIAIIIVKYIQDGGAI